MDAMARGLTSRRLGQLWQLPLLLVSLALFGVAAYLFIDPKPGPTIDQKIQVAKTYLTNGRPEPAIDYLNNLIAQEKLNKPSEGTIRLLLAQALEAAQKQKLINLPVNHEHIIEQTRLAMQLGVHPDYEVLRRMGDSYQALNRPADAIANYRQAAVLDPAKALYLQKRIAELQLAMGDCPAASVSLDEYVSHTEITDAERAWALREKAHIEVDRGAYPEARRILMDSLKLAPGDRPGQGQAHYYLGYCAWKLGQLDDAERYLRLSRDEMSKSHPQDADAAYVLGKIQELKKDYAAAISFYESVLESNPGHPSAPLALLGRGVNRIMLAQDDAGLTDLHDLVKLIGRKTTFAKYKDQTLDGLRIAMAALATRQEFQGALEALTYEQELEPKPTADFFSRLANIYELRAEQIEKASGEATPAAVAKREQQVRDLRCKAGDACVAFAKQVVLKDQAYGESLWKGIQLYNRAGDLQRVICALEMFINERPDDAMTPEALLQLGKAYQAGGWFDKAISAYQRNLLRAPNTLAGVKSAVPLALAYIAKGPEFYKKAENVLRGVVENNPVVTPAAQEFRQSLFELAQLYYRTERYEEAIARLEELTQRYKDEERMGQLLFLMGDCYRKSAALLDTRVAAGDKSAAGNIAEALRAKRERLGQAHELYDRVIETYRAAPPSGDLDKLYQKLAHFYRADCVFDLGDYEAAIKLYDAAAFRYQEDPSALAAYVQIVNCWVALHKYGEAKAANERATWLMRRMGPEAFQNGTFSMPKQYWEQWLKWSSEVGIWE